MMDEDRLDEWLDAWRVEPASAALREAVLAGAPKPRRRGLRLRSIAGPRLWFVGAGLAAGLAGLTCGAALAAVAVRNDRAEALVAGAAPEIIASAAEPTASP